WSSLADDPSRDRQMRGSVCELPCAKDRASIRKLQNESGVTVTRARIELANLLLRRQALYPVELPGQCREDVILPKREVAHARQEQVRRRRSRTRSRPLPQVRREAHVGREGFRALPQRPSA